MDTVGFPWLAPAPVFVIALVSSMRNMTKRIVGDKHVCIPCSGYDR